MVQIIIQASHRIKPSQILFWPRFLAVVVVLFVDVGYSPSQTIPPMALYEAKAMSTGFWITLGLYDNGQYGAYYANENFDIAPGCVYPTNSNPPIEHLVKAGIWIGAMVDTGRFSPRIAKLVTTTDDWDEYPVNMQLNIVPGPETTTIDTLHPFIRTSIRNDDTGAVSEGDVICTYTDTGRVYPDNIKYSIPNHYPLGVKIIQRTYSWLRLLHTPIIPTDYTLINLGKHSLKNVMIGIHGIPELYPSVYFPRVVPGYWPELISAYADAPGTTPLAIVVLRPPFTYSDSTFRFHYYPDFQINNLYWSSTNYKLDKYRYDYLKGTLPTGLPPISPNLSPENAAELEYLISFGPFAEWFPSDTLHLSFAFVSGTTLRTGSDNLYDNCMAAQTLYARDYVPPISIPGPKIRVEQGFRSVKLEWSYDNTGINPVDVWDDKNTLTEVYPADHWRRKNPPPGHTTGGRPFLGYRLYRSEDPTGTINTFTPLGEFMIHDSAGLGVGLVTSYIDNNLMPGRTYWYSVTSFGMNDVHVIHYPDRQLVIQAETLSTSGAESSVMASRVRAKITFSVGETLGEVKVVPNPYRADANYSYENGGYEGRANSWTENKRLLKFIHLPANCTIKIFSLAGDIIATIPHDNPRVGEEDWNLLSESGRTIASGIYIFTIESELGTQIGKFVVIR
jgi:hypothetical protein